MPDVSTSVDITSTIGVVLYKLACLFAGTLICYFGYRLFLAGVVGKAGDLKGQYAGWKVEIKSAAPGTFFAILGAAIICFTVVTGLTLDRDTYNTTSSTLGSAPQHEENRPTFPDSASDSTPRQPSKAGSNLRPTFPK